MNDSAEWVLEGDIQGCFDNIRSLLRHSMVGTATDLPGTEVSEVEYQAAAWLHPRRLILLRHRQADRPDAGGRKLIDVPGYVFQSLITSMPTTVAPLTVWRDYNGRSDCENVIKELQQGFALLAVPPRERDWWRRF